MVLHIQLGAVSADDADDSNRYLRYVDFLGQALVTDVKFTVNGNPLDEYDSDVHCMHEKLNFKIYTHFSNPNFTQNRHFCKKVGKILK